MMTRTVRLDGQDAGDPAEGGVGKDAKPTVSPQHASEPTIGSLVADAHTSFSTLLHGEIELAKLEVKASVKNAGTGAGMFMSAAILLVFSLTFGLIALA